jgi:hypothetical protein
VPNDAPTRGPKGIAAAASRSAPAISFSQASRLMGSGFIYTKIRRGRFVPLQFIISPHRPVCGRVPYRISAASLSEFSVPLIPNTHPELAMLSFDFRDPHVVEDSHGRKVLYDEEHIRGWQHTLRMTAVAPLFALGFVLLGVVKYFSAALK